MSRMLEALRRVEDRRQAGEEPGLLVRPRRARPAPAEEPDARAPMPVPAPAPQLAEPVGPAPSCTPFQAAMPAGPGDATSCDLACDPVATATPAERAAASSSADRDGSGEIPHAQGSPAPETQRVAQPRRVRRLDAQFLQLAERVLAHMPNTPPTVVGFCAVGPVAWAAVAPLAAALVQQLPGEIVVVEADTPPSSLAERLGILAGRRRRIPLEVLRTGIGWTGLAQPTGIPRLSLLPGMGELLAPVMPPGPSRWDLAVQELSQQHPLVLVVGAPSEGPAGLAPFKTCDGVFVLAALGCTGTRQARRIIESIQQAGGTVRGVILVDPQVS